jgi:hypothetical protein
VVQKKQSNVLDKPVGHKSSTVTAPVGVGNGGGGGNAVSADIDIKKLTVCTPPTRFLLTRFLLTRFSVMWFSVTRFSFMRFFIFTSILRYCKLGICVSSVWFKSAVSTS